MKATTKPTPFNKLAKPEQRALVGAGIKTMVQLAQFTETDMLKLHGMGKNAIQTLKMLLADSGLSLKKE